MSPPFPAPVYPPEPGDYDYERPRVLGAQSGWAMPGAAQPTMLPPVTVTAQRPQTQRPPRLYGGFSGMNDPAALADALRNALTPGTPLQFANLGPILQPPEGNALARWPRT